jgi:hypothetical protein
VWLALSSVLADKTSVPIGRVMLNAQLTMPPVDVQFVAFGPIGNVCVEPVCATPLTETRVSEICEVAGERNAARRFVADVCTGAYCCSETAIDVVAVPAGVTTPPPPDPLPPPPTTAGVVDDPPPPPPHAASAQAKTAADNGKRIDR